MEFRIAAAAIAFAVSTVIQIGVNDAAAGLLPIAARSGRPPTPRAI